MSVTDTDSSLFSLAAKLDFTLGKMGKELEQSNALARAARSREYPRTVKFHGNAIVPASGFAIMTMDLSAPPQGHFWYVRKIVVGGLTPTTAAAGRLDVFVSRSGFGQVTSLAQVGLTDWQDQATSLPLIGTYDRGQLPMQFQEVLHLVLSNATPGQQYVAAGIIEDYEEASTNLRLP